MDPGAWGGPEGEGPRGETDRATERLKAAVRYAVLAPSRHNSQPWCFEVHGGRLRLWADRARGLPASDPEGRELTLSCGAALFNLRTALRCQGQEVEVMRCPSEAEPDLLAEVQLGPERTVPLEEARLFAALPARRTNRQPFLARSVPPGLLHELQHAAQAEQAWLLLVVGKEREALAALVAEADRAQHASRGVRRELASWLSREGSPEPSAERDAALVRSAPVLAVLGTARDSPESWLRAGEALEHVLLRAQAEEVSASYLSQPVEVPALRERLAGLLATPGRPQVALSLGYAPQGAATPRRPVEEVLV